MALRIVIIGAGEVGFNLAKELSREDYDITMVEIDPARVKRASETLDVNTVEGNGASPVTLRQAQVEGADIFLALTRIDEVNLVSSQMAKALGARTVIARLRNIDFTGRKAVMVPKEFGIDEVIHPEKVAAEEVERLLRQSSALDIKEFEGGRLQLVGIMLNGSAPVLGRSLAEVTEANGDIPHKVIAITRDEVNFIPQGDTVYQAGDVAYLLGEEQHLPAILQMLGRPSREVKKIMILGAGKIGRRLARSTQEDLDVKLVEADKTKAWEIAPTLVNTMVLHGDGTDIDFLISENIHEMDSFIAVTQDEKTNLLTGLLAKHLGARHVIVHLNTTSYLPIARRIGIDSTISKNLVTVEAIMRVIKSSSGREVSRFEDVDLEAIEIVTEPGSPATRHPIKDLKFPKGLILGAIFRGPGVELPVGDTQILAGDRVLIFVKNEQLEKVEKFFS
ncbi:MAG: Trk system potassium transporter TrkA [Candidatus Marinimicrobia bacterium]|nr:Trk system potassium transporter TrkA [Candidatus Neomarinimicrobiota bacterium]